MPKDLEVSKIFCTFAPNETIILPYHPMRKTTIILALLSLCLTAVAKSSKTVTIQLIETSDVHGAFFPYNFTERRPMQGTMARVSTYLKRQRQQYGKNVILLDNGDILQGQPTCYYTNFVATDKPNIAAEVINYMQFDAETFGNNRGMGNAFTRSVAADCAAQHRVLRPVNAVAVRPAPLHGKQHFFVVVGQLYRIFKINFPSNIVH